MRKTPHTPSSRGCRLATGVLAASALGFGTILLGLGSRATAGAQEKKPWVAPRRAARKKNPIPASAQSIKAGAEVFRRECISCHGEDGRGKGPKAAELEVPPGNLTEAKVQDQTDGTLYWKITKGRAPMASFKTLLTDEQRWQVINSLRTLAANPEQVTPPRFHAPESYRKAISAVIEPYLKVHEALAKDDLATARGHLEPLVDAARKLAVFEPDALTHEAQDDWSKDLQALLERSEELGDAETIDALRERFAAFSAALIKTIRNFGHDQKRPLSLFTAEVKYRGEPATWIQMGREPVNPYGGPGAPGPGTLKMTLGNLQPPKT